MTEVEPKAKSIDGWAREQLRVTWRLVNMPGTRAGRGRVIRSV